MPTAAAVQPPLERLRNAIVAAVADVPSTASIPEARITTALLWDLAVAPAVRACALDLRHLLHAALDPSLDPSAMSAYYPNSNGGPASAARLPPASGSDRTSGPVNRPPDYARRRARDPLMTDDGDDESTDVGKEVSGNGNVPEDAVSAEMLSRIPPSVAEVARIRLSLAICLHYMGHDQEALEVLEPAATVEVFETLGLDASVSICIMASDLLRTSGDAGRSDRVFKALEALLERLLNWKNSLSMFHPTSSAAVRDHLRHSERSAILLTQARSLAQQKKLAAARSCIGAANDIATQISADDTEASHLAAA
ncbi:hypothetical protein HK405_004351, partial [Cladochytrium tenue]